MARDIAAKLKSPDARQTKSDVLIANYIERNLAELPFETAKSIAQNVGVSQMTVGRYLRRLGYGGLDELKREMRQSAHRTGWQVKGNFERLRRDAREGKLIAALIQQQIDDLGHIYEITMSPQWNQAIDLLIGAEEVFIAAYQNVRGVAQYFASQLSYARPRVEFVDGLNGTYVEVLDGSVENRCLFLFDVRRFANKARPLAEEARAAGVKVILLTDDACVWAQDVSDVALVMPGARGPLWDGAAITVSLMDLMISHVIVELGDKVNQRVDRLTRLQDVFGDFES
ncbi:MurR/RpiR family transcriptional regulator [Ollibium composti]|jgi:DNA-binding MurR/RpiR family transcriptional regulator|uniref:MurR/RpiR family transcriptional regulator n=1 Tax=Ollibium composti TaxID=2675109 RepID=A0ABY2Q8N6_9HYPH|nr:MurR/RpiR family transcriptional regulator [Mesorhizobium composti]THF57791.1 MurR/RpiR family transcriptional regulator [Mesorhizobium composti]